MASEKSLNLKKEEVSKLAEKMKDAKLVLLTDYRGINVDDVTKLRTDLRNVKSEYKVIKNNITKRALEECKVEGLEEQLEGPTAVIMTDEDYLSAIKVIYNFAKKNDYYKIKGGVVEGKVMTADEITTLAKLPSRQDLLSMLAGALLANISKFAVVLEQVRVKKETETPAEEVKASAEEKVEEAKTEEPAEAKAPETETKAEEPAEAKAEEVKEEAPAEEPKEEEAPKADAETETK